jgi:hypothetical protein
MQPSMHNSPLASQPWFVEFLAKRGFREQLPGSFTNGKATIRVQGREIASHPGTGDKEWTADLTDADRETVEFMVSQILKIRPFGSETNPGKETVERDNSVVALSTIATSIKEGPETGSGVQLRRCLWSLYNMRRTVNLWRMTGIQRRKSAWPRQNSKSTTPKLPLACFRPRGGRLTDSYPLTSGILKGPKIVPDATGESVTKRFQVLFWRKPG